MLSCMHCVIVKLTEPFLEATISVSVPLNVTEETSDSEGLKNKSK